MSQAQEKQAPPTLDIRWMIRRDVMAVTVIEDESFDYPWSEGEFIRTMKYRNVAGMVATMDRHYVVGYMVYEIHKNRLHLLNFAVAKAFRNQGVGSEMVKKLKSKLTPDRRNRINFEVRESNVKAQVFFRKHGFKAISVLRNFYEESPEDAYLMQYRHMRPWTPGNELAADQNPFG